MFQNIFEGPLGNYTAEVLIMWGAAGLLGGMMGYLIRFRFRRLYLKEVEVRKETQQELLQRQSEIQSLSAQLADCQKQAEDLVQQLNTSNSEKANALHEIERLNQQCTECLLELGNLQEEVKSLEKQVEEERDKRHQMEEDYLIIRNRRVVSAYRAVFGKKKKSPAAPKD